MQRQQPHVVDVLADALSATRLGATVFARSELTSPWGMAFEPAAWVGLHIVARGSCWLRPRGKNAHLHLAQGDVVLLPHGSGHSLVSEPSVRALPFEQILKRCQGAQGPNTLSRSPEGKGPSSVLLSGAYRFEHEGIHPLLSLLPSLIHIPAEEGLADGPMEAVLRLLVSEFSQPGPGSVTVTARLVDVLFIQVIRRWLERQPEGSAGWLGAVRDPQVGRALALMHAEPRRDWTVDTLAAEVGCSRATFARRFRELVREPPLVYLTRLRMDVAARLLRESDQPLAAVAERVGYASEFAFNRTFHRVRGLPPGRYREEAREALPSPLAREAPVARPESAARILVPNAAAQVLGRGLRGLGERGKAARSVTRRA